VQAPAVFGDELLEPGSQIGISPFFRRSILSASMSMHQTSLPTSANPPP
jgi:hypothetical protein